MVHDYLGPVRRKSSDSASALALRWAPILNGNLRPPGERTSGTPWFVRNGQNTSERCDLSEVACAKARIEQRLDDLVDRTQEDFAPPSKEIAGVGVLSPHEGEVVVRRLQHVGRGRDEPIRNCPVQRKTAAFLAGHRRNERDDRLEPDAPGHAAERTQGRALPCGFVGGNGRL